MPRGDGTGPMGEGPMTGGGRGFCTTSSTDDTTTGARYGCGRGRGYGRMANANEFRARGYKTGEGLGKNSE